MYLTPESDVCFLLLFINVSFSQFGLAFWVVTSFERDYVLYLAVLFKMSHPGILQISPTVSFILQMGMHAIVFTYLRKHENNISNLRCCVEPISRKNSSIASWHQPGNFVTSRTAFIVKWIFILFLYTHSPLGDFSSCAFSVCVGKIRQWLGAKHEYCIYDDSERDSPVPLLDVTKGVDILISQTRCGIISDPEGSDSSKSDDQ